MVIRPDVQREIPGRAVHALVLAAGAGTRMGGEKLRRPWRGRPLFAWAVEAALAAPVERVWAVTGADEGLGDLVPDDPRLAWVKAANWADGLSATLKAGVAALPASAGAAIVFLGDMPRVPAQVSATLIDAWTNGAVAAAPAFGGHRGHPVLLDRSLFGQVSALTGDRGAGGLLAALSDRLALVEAPDDGVLFDVDTPDMLEA